MKLEIKSVMLRNFLSFGDRPQEIEFKNGVNMVLGKDLSTGRSNGAGKSSFLESIPFALYGTTHKNIVKAQLINWKNRKNLEVILNFKKGDIDYKIVRCIKPDNFEIWENNNLIDKPPHTRDYQKILEDIIGLNLNTFSSLIHSNINSSNRILSMNKPEKRKFIEDVFGLHIYSFLNNQAHLKINEQTEKIKDVQRTIDHNQISMDEIRRQISDIQSKIDRLGSSQMELKDAEILLEESEEKFPNIENDIHDIENDIESLTIKISDTKQLFTKVETTLSNENSLLNNIKIKFLKLEDAEKFREQLKKLEFNRGSLDNILKNIINTKDSIKKITEDFKKQSNEYNELAISIAKIETQYDNINSKIGNLSKHKECPTCGQQLKSGQKDIVKQFNEELTRLEKIEASQKNNMQSTRKKKNTLESSLASQIDELSEMEDTRDKIYSIKNKIQVDYTRKDLEKEEQDIKNKIVKLNSQSGLIETEIHKINNKISIQKEELENLKSKKAVIDSKRRKIEALKMQVQLEERSKHEFQSIIASHRIKIDDYEIDIIQSNKKISTYKVVTDYLEIIKEVCKDENIKQYAISSIMPYLNKQTNHYLSEVGYGFYCILNRWLDADIKGPGIKNGSYGSLSGGEARGIDLALQFALLDIARIQAGIWPDILSLDEILDSSVDGKGISKLMDIIKIKQSQENNKIFLISHRDEIGDSIDADFTYFVTKDKGFSGVKII